MIKSLFLFILCLFVFNAVFAQKKDTSVYYLKTSGKVVSTKDSADYFLVILPPDTSVDKNLFIVQEFYRNGKRRLMGNSKTNSLNLKFQGFLVNFYPNGHKMMIRNYNNGEPLGDEIQYYPNGKLYNIRSYTKDKKVFLKQYNDSTGNVLAENGKGKWTEFDENFSEVNAEGEIENGIEAGTWHGRVDDSTNFESVFVKGKVISTTRTYKYKPNGETFTSVDIVPEFPGGLEAFARFLYRNIRYPALARENNTSGRVIVNFVVERDGSLSDVKVARGIGDGCDEEAVRIIKLSPRWKPGIQNGKPVRVSYSVPIGFSLGK